MGNGQTLLQQRQHSSGVPEQHSVAPLEPAFTAVGEQTCGGFAGVDGIEQYPFLFSKELRGFARLGGRHSIALADEVRVDV